MALGWYKVIKNTTKFHLKIGVLGLKSVLKYRKHSPKKVVLRLHRMFKNTARIHTNSGIKIA